MLLDRQQHKRQRGTRVICFVVEVFGDWRNGALPSFHCITSSLVKIAVPGQTLRLISYHYGAFGLLISKCQTQSLCFWEKLIQVHGCRGGALVGEERTGTECICAEMVRD